jgi:hypothetical protein
MRTSTSTRKKNIKQKIQETKSLKDPIKNTGTEQFELYVGKGVRAYYTCNTARASCQSAPTAQYNGILGVQI